MAIATFTFPDEIKATLPAFSAEALSFNFNHDTAELDHRLGALMQVQKVIVALMRADKRLSLKTSSILSEDIGSFGYMIAQRVNRPGITCLVSCPRLARLRSDQWQIGWEIKIAETVTVNRERAGHITAHAAAMVTVAVLDGIKVQELAFATMRVTGANRTSDEANDVVLSYTVTGTVDVMLKKTKVEI